jgi:hypothetical protein
MGTDGDLIFLQDAMDGMFEESFFRLFVPFGQ